MERLIKDAAKLDKSVKKNDMSFGNIVKAIHAVQENLGITGTTAKEAAETIQGSAAAMSAAWSNLLVGLSDPTQDFNGLLDQFVYSLQTFMGNVLKLLPNIATGIERLITGITPYIGELVESILPTLISSATSLIMGLISALPGILMVLGQEIPKALMSMLDSNMGLTLPMFVDASLQMITTLANGFSDNLPVLVSKIAWIVGQIVQVLINDAPMLIDAAVQLFNGFVIGLMQAMPFIIESLPTLITSIATNLILLAPQIADAGLQLFNAMLEYFPQFLDSVMDAVGQIGDLLSDKIPALSFVFDNLDTFVMAAVGAFVAFKSELLIGDIIEKAKKAIQMFGDAITGVMSLAAAHPVGAAIVAIGALIGILVDLYHNNEDFRNFVDDAWDKIKGWIVTAKDAIVEAWENLKTKVGELWDNIKEAKDNIVKAWDDLKSKITSAKDNIVKAWDNVKSKATEIKDNITSAFETLKKNVTDKWNNIKSSIMNPINYVKSWLEDKIQKIKNLFDFDWSFPKPKMPHFTVSGSFDLTHWPPKVPHVSIDWYRKAMDNPLILDGATIFGMAGGKLLGGGEAGPEIVSGANTLMGMIEKAVSRSSQSIGTIYINVDGAQYDDVDELANTIAEKLQGIVDRRSAAWA